MTKEQAGSKSTKIPRGYTILSVAFIFVLTLLVAFVVTPKLNQFSDKEQAINIQEEITIEIDLFKKFLEAKIADMHELAKLPSVKQAVSRSDKTDEKFIRFQDNLSVEGGTAIMTLHTIKGEILAQTSSNTQGEYDKDSEWQKKLANKEMDYHFDLFGQKNEDFSFLLSIPVLQNDEVKAFLSAELTIPKSLAFISPSYDSNIAIYLLQNGKKVHTDLEKIEYPIEVSKNIEHPALKFIYIINDQIALQQHRNTKNITLSVIFLGLIASFIFFGLLGFSTFSEDNEQATKPNAKQIWQPYIFPVAIGVIGLTATMMTYFIFKSVQDASYHNELKKDAQTKIQLVQAKIEESYQILDATKAYFNLTERVSKNDFQKFSKPLLEKREYINSIHWIPSTPENRLEEFKITLQANGVTNNNIDNLTNDKNSVYYPTYFVEPFQANTNLVGWSHTQDQKHLSAIEKAKNTGKKTAAITTIDNQKEFSNLGYFIFNPIYSNDGLNDVQSQEEGTIKGFIALNINVEKLFSETAKGEFEDIDFLIRDQLDVRNPQAILDETKEGDEVFYKKNIPIADKKWEIIAHTNHESSFHWEELLIFTVGFGISSMVVLSLLNLISRKKTLEDTVQKRTAELRMANDLISNSDDMFVITEASKFESDNHCPKIVYVNEAFSNTTGYSNEEALKATPGILQGKNTNDNEIKQIQQKLLDGQSYTGEIVNYTKDDREYWVNASIWPLKDETGNTTHYGSVVRDISDKKDAEKEREKLIDSLVDSNESLERFAYVCSHDMQEPLRMIRSFSELLNEHLSESLANDDQAKKYCDFITDGSTRAQTLIDDILTYSSLDSNIQAPEKVDLNELIKLIEKNIFLNAGEHNNKITSDPLPEMIGNKTQLFQLFQNLINNGMKYQAPDNDAHVHISAKETDDCWEFCVQDNGIGIDAKHQQKIFEVFKRLHRKADYAGTGIGLSICQKIVDRHGGKIWVESEKNQGSKFYFTIQKIDSV